MATPATKNFMDDHHLPAFSIQPVGECQSCVALRKRIAALERDNYNKQERLRTFFGLSNRFMFGHADRETAQKIIKMVQLRVCEEFQITLDEMLSKARPAKLINARHLAIYLSSQLTGASTSVIGALFIRDHGSIINALEKTKGLMESYPKERVCIERFQAELKKELEKAQ